MSDEIQPIPVSRGIMDRPYTGKEIKAQVAMIQEVIEEVFEEGHHYGNIPGTQGKTLLKPGSEKLNLTFRIAPEPIIEDLSTADEIRYRVTCRANHIVSGDYLGAGVGEASSNEEKYKWRRAVCKEEYDETPEDRRREVWKKKRDRSTYQVKQVRTNPPDLANTILKMAKKRAQVDMTLTVTAASDIFVQDYEDITPEMRHMLGQDDESLMEPARKSEAKKEEKQEKKASEKKPASSKKKEKPGKRPPVKQTTAGVLPPTPKPKEEKNAFEEAAEARSEPPPTPPGDPDEPASISNEEDDGEADVPFGEPPAEDGETDFFTAQIETAKEGRRGTSKNTGKEWVLYEIHTSSGDKLTTFNERLYQEAVRACEEGLLCKLFWEENQYGFTLNALEPVG